jgi:hypothetical protein
MSGDDQRLTALESKLRLMRMFVTQTMKENCDIYLMRTSLFESSPNIKLIKQSIM